MKEDISSIIKEVADSVIIIGNSNPSSLKPFTNRIIESFQLWLLEQAKRDSTRNYRQTKAYELYLRLSNTE